MSNRNYWVVVDALDSKDDIGSEMYGVINAASIEEAVQARYEDLHDYLGISTPLPSIEDVFGSPERPSSDRLVYDGREKGTDFRITAYELGI